MAERNPNPQAAPGTPPGSAAPPQAPPDKKPEQYLYRCTERCTWGGHYRKVGETVLFDKKTDIPHFELIT
jgi:hypothetical protein